MTIIREPDFLVCRECDSPTYLFEWHYEKEVITEALCETCGNAKLDEFDTDEEYYDEEA